LPFLFKKSFLVAVMQKAIEMAREMVSWGKTEIAERMEKER
jgi:hypothetical protein